MTFELQLWFVCVSVLSVIASVKKMSSPWELGFIHFKKAGDYVTATHPFLQCPQNENTYIAV